MYKVQLCQVYSCKVVGMDKDYAIIENDEHKAHEQGYIINYNDMIITNPDKFVEGQLVY